MLTRFAALLLGVYALIGHASGQQTSVLHLERGSKEQGPYQTGNGLSIQGNTALPGLPWQILVLDVRNWPWVFVKAERGESWINMTDFAVASRLR